MEIWNLIADVLSGLIVCVPLVIMLVKKVKEAVDLKSYPQLVGIIASYMSEAETKMTDGATKKEWVLGMLRTSAEITKYNFTDEDWKKIGSMIDSLCEMSKNVNTTNG